MHPTVKLRATYDCVSWGQDVDGCPDTDPTTWGGFCDPRNPWGTADDDLPDSLPYDGGEPIEIELPIYEAAQFIFDFPGAIWDLEIECDPSHNYRTGVASTVVLHVDGQGAPAALEIAAGMYARDKTKWVAYHADLWARRNDED